MSSVLDNFILFDVANAIITDKTSKERFLSKYLTTSSISQTSSETEIRGGQGAALLALIESEKSVEITLGSATVSKKWLEMQQGAKFENKQVTIIKTEKVTVEEDATDPTNVLLKGTIKGTADPKEKTITITNCEGETENGTLTAPEFIVPEGFAEAGDTITVLYKANVLGETLEIDANVFPKGWELQLEVPAMDKCTQEVTHKVIFVFDNVRPSSTLDLSFSMSEAIAPEMTLKVMQSCCSSGLGKMIIVPINETP